MRPLFFWMGSKAAYIPRLRPLFPKFNEYREPFAGGASVFWGAGWKAEKSWLNDSDQLLVNFYRIVQSKAHNQELCRLILKHRPFNCTEDRNVVLKECREWAGSKTLDVEKALQFLLLSASGFCGCVYATGARKRWDGARWRMGEFDRLDRARRIAQAHACMKSCTVTLGDFKPVVEAPGKDVFIFLDPPYPEGGKGGVRAANRRMYRHFHDDVHPRLRKALQDCPHKWMITVSEHPWYRRYYSAFNIREIVGEYASRRRNRKAVELVIRNYD